MNFEFPKTLSYYNDLPYFQKWDASGVPCSVGIEALRHYQASAGKASVDEDALVFYCLNHLVQGIKAKHHKYQVLPEWAQPIMERYVAEVITQTQRLYAYMVMICTREARHFQMAGVTPQWWAEFYKYFDASVAKLIQGMTGNEGTFLEMLFKNPPVNTTMAQYMQALSYVFNKSNWPSSYGGPMWGNIANTVIRFLLGHTSAEVMVDTAYTLAHNGGPMFNKGMLYHSHSSSFISLLNVQASGQIPSGVLEGHFLTPMSKGISLKTMVELYNKNLGGIAPLDMTKVPTGKQSKLKSGDVVGLVPLVVTKDGFWDKKFKLKGTFYIAPNAPPVEMYQRLS